MEEKQNFKSLSSGLKELIAQEHSERRFEELKELLVQEKHQELENYFKENPELIDSTQLKALKLISLIILGKRIQATDISFTPLKSFLADALAKELAKIALELKIKLNTEELEEFFPKLTNYLEGNLSLAKKDIEPKYKLELLETSLSFDAQNFQNQLADVYQEISKIQESVAQSQKINKETCFNASCTDCCIYTPPMVTKLEFEYIKAHHDIKPFLAQAQANQKDHEEKFSSKLRIVDLDKEDKLQTNPHDFAHPCPFLDENKSCSIHEHRPFACRYYGLSTIDGKSVQACSYYLEQYPSDKRAVLDSRKPTELLGKANRKLCQDLGLKQSQAAGTLTAWLDGV